MSELQSAGQEYALKTPERLGAEAVILDTYGGDPEETRHPDEARAVLTSVATTWKERP